MSRITVFLSGVAAAAVMLVLLLTAIEPTPIPRVAATSAVLRSSPPDDQDVAPGLPSDHDGYSMGRDRSDDMQLDLEGDEVEPAVATYKLDAQGNIYETHAPHTEVPRLGPPKT